MKIICIGRNYSAHSKELGNPVPTEPVFFCKPDSALLPRGMPFFIPDWTREVHFEVELLIRIQRLGKNIEEKFASRYYSEIGLGIDFTARDVQEELKKKSLPWEKAKGFDGSAVVSETFLPMKNFPPGTGIEFRLDKNGSTVQRGNSAEMSFSIDQLIAYTSQFMTLKIGDLLFTGTPSGVGPVAPGDKLEGWIGQTKLLDINIR